MSNFDKQKCLCNIKTAKAQSERFQKQKM